VQGLADGSVEPRSVRRKDFDIPIDQAEDLQGGLAGVIRLHAIIDRYLKERP
jgi:hypothetical protein